MTIERLIVGITGASGACYGIDILQQAQKLKLKTHLIITKPAHLTITQETDYSIKQVQEMADVVHPVGDVGACIASGSYRNTAMVVAPCSMHSLAEIALGLSGNLLTRAADVMLKERRPMVLMVRETPLHAIHLQHMTTLAHMGVVMMPPVPAFYHRPATIAEMVRHTSAKALEALGIETGNLPEWKGLSCD